MVQRRPLARLALCAALLGAAHAAGCGDDEDDGHKKTGGTGGSAPGGAGDEGGADTGGTSAGKGGTSGKGGNAGAAGTSTGGSTGKGGTSATGGATGGHGGEGDMGGETNGGAGGEGGEGPLPTTTCKAIHDARPSAASGAYVLDPPGNSGDPFLAYCEMTMSGGGWTLGFTKNSAHDGHYEDFGAAYVRVAALAESPTVASTSTTGAAGWVDLNTFPYSELRLAGYLNGARAFLSNAIAKSTLRLMFGQNGYFLYNDANGYYWCGGEYAYTTDGVGQENKPTGAPDDCKGHTALGDGYDFSTSNGSNQGLTLCGGGSVRMTSSPLSAYVTYGTPGAGQAIWVR